MLKINQFIGFRVLWRAGGVLRKSEACGYSSSFTPPLFQSGTSIERLDFNQRLLLIILCGAALAVSCATRR